MKQMKQGEKNHQFLFYLFSVRLRHSDFHRLGDCYACNNGEKLCGEYFDRPSDLTSFVYILADAFSLRQFTSKVTLRAEKKALKNDVHIVSKLPLCERSEAQKRLSISRI